MNPSEKIKQMLAKEGLKVTSIHYAEGNFKRADVARWGGWVTPDERWGKDQGWSIYIHSWDTMTRCARQGITVRRCSDRREFEADALPKKSKS